VQQPAKMVMQQQCQQGIGKSAATPKANKNQSKRSNNQLTTL